MNRPGAEWKLRPAGFGLIVVEHADPFNFPHALLPSEKPPTSPGMVSITDVRHVTYADLEAYRRAMLEQFFGASPANQAAPAPAPATPAELRQLKEREASSSTQPFEWASRVYVTVHGDVRWSCCGNLFDDDHSPYCGSTGDRS